VVVDICAARPIDLAIVDGIDPQSWDALMSSPDRPLNNRAIAGLYPPGSTFKPFMALAALELGKRTPASAIQDPGFFVFGDRRFRDSKPGGHGTVDLYKSIVVSSDTYYYMLANDMGIDAIASFMKRFGFGARTGIDLDGEVAGVQTTASERYGKRTTDSLGWSQIYIDNPWAVSSLFVHDTGSDPKQPAWESCAKPH